MQLEANRKESLASRKGTSKKRGEDARDGTASASPSVTLLNKEIRGGPVACNTVMATVAPSQARAGEPFCAVAEPAQSCKVDWRKVTSASVVLGIVISLLAIR